MLQTDVLLDTIAQALDATHGCWVTDRPDVHPEVTYRINTDAARAALHILCALDLLRLADIAADLVQQERECGQIAGPLEALRHWCYDHHPAWAAERAELSREC